MHSFFEKIDVFGDIVYDDKWHSYTIGGKKTVSVTKVTGSAKPPFDDVTVSRSSARKQLKAANPDPAYEPTDAEIDPVAVRLSAEWKVNNLVSTEKGSAAHKYIESAMANKFERYDPVPVHESFERLRAEFPEKYPGIDPEPLIGSAEASVRPKYDGVIRLMDAFKRDIRGKMVPVKSEVVIGSPKYLICGMIDQIFWNVKSQQFELWDWKTNAKFETESTFRLLPPLNHLAKCHLDEYSLQLSLYRKMFTEMTGIPLGNSYLCWFCETEPTYRIFKCRDLTVEVEKLIGISMQERGIA